jgi:biotin transport system permease protein
MLTLTSLRETPLHRLPAGWKLAALAAASLWLFTLHSGAALGVTICATGAVYLWLGRDIAARGIALLRPLWPFLAVLGLWHLWIGDMAAGVFLAGRMLCAVALANLVTMTTQLEALIAVLTRLLAPTARIGLQPQVLALSVALVIRFTPVLMDKTAQLMQAWRARGGGRANWRIVLPIALIALDDADHVADALRARGGIAPQNGLRPE